ncbi:HAMP domain-containing protein [Brucepastera parasyntrophica]|uniref:PDC sensor domain-containing protein n=1 Tax=Brucepastera parasyntrophica TaxID=2880008 RepID=UPI00210E2A51|nr:cache domain-containing protein [Brucepastera parasyntrophica]ULQ58935.1 HAMP domain-containing protein [Brucepastera parasyntrophica]
MKNERTGSGAGSTETVKRRGSVKRKFLIVISSFTIVMLAVMGFTLYLRVADTTEQTYLASVEQQRTILDNIIHTFFSNIGNVASSLTEMEIVKEVGNNLTSYLDKNDPSGLNEMKPNSAYEAEINNLCKIIYDSYPEIFSAALASETDGGFIMYPPSARRNGYDPRTRPWYQAAFTDTGHIAFSSPYTTSVGELVISAVKTVHDERGTVKGVIMLDAHLFYLSEVLKNTKIGDNAFIIITDNDGRVIAHPSDHSMIFRNIADAGIKNFDTVAPQALEEYVTADFYDNTRYQIRLLPSQNGLMDLNYIVCIPENEIGNKNIMFVFHILASILFWSLVAVAFAFFLASVFSKPILTITKSLSAIEQGDLTVKVSVKNNDEFGQFADSFNETIHQVGKSIHSVIDEAQSMKKLRKNFPPI